MFLQTTFSCSEQVPRTSRLDYVRAYQQFFWNMIASKRIATFGLKPIIGDLVYAPVSDGCDTANNVNGAVVFITVGNINNYTINDVLLPLPGAEDTTFPFNEVADWYTDLLAADGVSDLKQRMGCVYIYFWFHLFIFLKFNFDLGRSYNIGKEYRFLIRKPSELSWKFVRYDDALMDLISSDLDRLLGRITESNITEGIISVFNVQKIRANLLIFAQTL